MLLKLLAACGLEPLTRKTLCFRPDLGKLTRRGTWALCRIAARNGTPCSQIVPDSATRQSLPSTKVSVICGLRVKRSSFQFRQRRSIHPLDLPVDRAEPVKRSRPTGLFRNEPDPAFYGPQDFIESVLLNRVVRPEPNMPTVRATSQPGFRLDFKRDVVEGAKMLKDDFDVDMKVAG